MRSTVTESWLSLWSFQIGPTPRLFLFQRRLASCGDTKTDSAAPHPPPPPRLHFHFHLHLPATGDESADTGYRSLHIVGPELPVRERGPGMGGVGLGRGLIVRPRGAFGRRRCFRRRSHVLQRCTSSPDIKFQVRKMAVDLERRDWCVASQDAGLLPIGEPVLPGPRWIRTGSWVAVPPYPLPFLLPAAHPLVRSRRLRLRSGEYVDGKD